jgi:hypothetical protein
VRSHSEPTASLGPTQRIEISLATVSASLSSSHPAFMAYAAQHLAPLRSRGGQPVSVEATLAWHEDAPPPDRAAAYPELGSMDRVDRDIYRAPMEIAWFRIDELPSLYLHFTWDGRRLRVHGDFYLYLSRHTYRNWIQRSVRWRHLAQLRDRRFTTLLYYLLYYPCFWVLERTRDLHPIHAAGVEMHGATIVLAGPSGVGKSTLVTGLAAYPDARLLSDTFLLHCGTTCSSVPEPLLLDRWSQRWLGDTAIHLTRIAHRYSLSREGFHWPAERSAHGGTARLLVFPQRSTGHYLRPLSPSCARGRLSAGNLVVNDLRRYWAFASVLELLDPTRLVLAREHSIARLIAATPAYELGICQDVTSALVSDELSAVLEETPAGAPHHPAAQPRPAARW